MSVRRLQCGWLIVCLISTALLNIAVGEPNNGSFELFDFNSVIDVNVPHGWFLENYTAAVGQFFPHPESGSYENWRFNATTGLLPFDGNSFLVLSSGDWPSNSGNAKAWQTVKVEAGEKLTGVYFFGTCDYWDFNDFAYIKLVPLEEDLSHSDVNIVYESLYSVCFPDYENYSSLSGWKRFEHTFDINDAGTYYLILFVSDYKDNAYDSYLAVDAIKICHNPSTQGDLNCDCTTNFEDYAIIANEWQCDCNDPDIYNGPNSNCLLGTDLNADGAVDVNDLAVFMESWLGGVKEEE